MSQLVLYTHGCKNSSNHHLRKYKHWSKHIKGVDVTKTNGYAFQGDFLAVTAEHKLPAGALVVEVCDTTATLYRMAPDGKVELFSAGTRSMSKLIEFAAAELGAVVDPLDSVPDADLIAALERRGYTVTK